jgi:CDP-diacylglycerol---serine O-phosphatidyltransferase
MRPDIDHDARHSGRQTLLKARAQPMMCAMNNLTNQNDTQDNDSATGSPSGPQRAPYFWLPNALTTGALWAGFYAIVAAIDRNFLYAGAAVLGAMIFDTLDGRVARWTNTQSEFGKEYDSLSDMVSFGLAPAIVVYQWGVAALKDYNVYWGQLGWLATFLYAAAAAMRLARFNTRTAVTDKRYFEGLPSPSAAATVAGFIWIAAKYELDGLTALVLAFVITLIGGALMVSRFAYWSFKETNLRGRVRWVYLLLIPVAYMLVLQKPGEAIFLLFAMYAYHAPLVWFWRKLFHRRRDAHAAVQSH